MRINRFEDVLGVRVQADIVEGRFGLLCQNNSATFDYGSGGDGSVPGFRVPATADEAEQARYVITWKITFEKGPYLVGMPSFEPGWRYGYDQSAQFPASVTYRSTYPGHQDSQTIPSGTMALAYGDGSYTIPSGQYIYNANLKKAGAFVIVANTAEDTTDAGKIKYQATSDDRVVGVVEEYDANTGDLVVRIRR